MDRIFEKGLGMKFQCNREEMANALSAVNAVTAARTPKPILQCVRIEAQPDVVLLTATDLEIGLRHATSQVEVGKTGEAVVRADLLAQIVRECPDETLALDVSKSQLHIRGAGSHFQIATHAVEDFPPVAGFEGEADFTAPQGELRRMIEWTVFASARESSRYAINGVLWEQSNDRLSVVATDGRRLSMARGTVKPTKADGTSSSILAPKVLNLFTRLATDPDGQVHVKLTHNQVILNLGRAVLSSALVEGHFPNYRDVIPTDLTKTAELDTAEFQGALKRAALLTSEESRAVRLSLSSDTLVLSSRAPEQGEASITMSIRYRGEPLDIGFNPVFLIDALRVTPTEKITMLFREANRPGIMKLDDNFLYVVMPVSLGTV